MQGYPLRPELMESTYLLYAATRDPSLLEVPLGSALLLPYILPQRLLTPAVYSSLLSTNYYCLTFSASTALLCFRPHCPDTLTALLCTTVTIVLCL